MINTAVENPADNGHLSGGMVDLNQWLENADLNGAEVDCVTAVMLKILDGKCKMPPAEKVIMEALYDCARGLSGLNLGEPYHQLICRARESANESLLEEVYETRVLAETQISRPVMKKFKARLRVEGVLPARLAGVGDDD